MKKWDELSMAERDPYHSKKAKARGRQMLNTKVVKDWLSGTHKER